MKAGEAGSEGLEQDRNGRAAVLCSGGRKGLAWDYSTKLRTLPHNHRGTLVWGPAKRTEFSIGTHFISSVPLLHFQVAVISPKKTGL